MSELINRKFKCTGCGEARPCYLETTQEKDEIAFFDATEHLTCVLDKTNQTSYNWQEIEANVDNKDHEPSINYDGVLDAVNCVGCGSELTEHEKKNGGNCCDDCWLRN